MLGKSPVFGWNDTIDINGPQWTRHVCAAPSRAAIQRLVGHNLNPRDAQCFGETWNYFEVEHCRAHPGIVFRVDGPTGAGMKFVQVAPALALPSTTDDKGWECNECGSKEYTGSVSEEDIESGNLSCSSCGGCEFHWA